MFEFEGSLDSSKSLVNRALIIQSYEPKIQLDFQSQSMDVRVLKKAISDFLNGRKEFHCADAGTAFRFLVLRLSREPGTWTVTGSERLLSRPQSELKILLEQLGVKADVQAKQWTIHTSGWKPIEEISVDTSLSSQFASSILLNCWNLAHDLCIRSTGSHVSESYFEMTLHLIRHFGLDVVKNENKYLIRAQQKPRLLCHSVEADMSSCFSLASCAVQNGQARIQNFPFDSRQPDLTFLDLFQEMGVLFSREKQTLIVQKTAHLKSITCNLKNTPDLFPVLAVLCARASGVSCLSGLDHLTHKESDRLMNTIQLLKRLGRKTEIINNQLMIYGEEALFQSSGDFDPDQDHRMAMAARAANLYGASLRILTPDVVEKSFPQFWQITGGVG